MPDMVFFGEMAYNGGTYLTSAISTSRISIDINNSVNRDGRIWCTTCGVCYEYMIYIDSFYMGRTTEPNAKAMCFCTGTQNDNELINIINQIAVTKSAGPFLSMAAAMSWVRTEGIFITNQNYPMITTLNHVLLIDAGLTASYPNQGTDWYNMATSSNNGTLNGGITWTNIDRGYLDFNGTTGYVSFASTSDIPVGNSNYTINLWFNADTRTGTDGLIGWGGYGTNNAVNAIKLTSTGIENVWGGNDLSVTTTITAGLWYNVVATFDGTTRRLYLNGVQIGSDTPTNHNVTTSSNMTVGRTDSSEYFDGKISLVQILPSALNATDILSNYNKFNSRYDGTFTEICIPNRPCDPPPDCNPVTAINVNGTVVIGEPTLDITIFLERTVEADTIFEIEVTMSNYPTYNMFVTVLAESNSGSKTESIAGSGPDPVITNYCIRSVDNNNISCELFKCVGYNCPCSEPPISPTPTMTPPPTPPLYGQCIDVTSNETGVIFLDYKRRDGVQACQPIGQGQTLPVCVYPGEGGNIESWDGFPCSGPNNLLPPSAISIVPVPYGCVNAGDCVQETLTAITLCWDASARGGVKSLGCGLTSICVCNE